MTHEKRRPGMSHEKRQLQKHIKTNLEELGHRLNGRPLTVALIGTVGVGKSSLINTISAAMSTKHWHEHAFTGSHGNHTLDPVTAYTRRYPQCCREEEHKNPLMPTLLDIGGLPDQLDNTWKEVLTMVFYGRVPENENILDVHNYLQNIGEMRIPKYTKTDDKLKVDRVLVVASATEAVPENLLEMVVRAARPLEGPSRRAIPIFGVMTKTDMVDPDVDKTFLRREEKFKEILGLTGTGTRYRRCINYCSNIDPDDARIHTSFPLLDIPVLRLMTQICDPAIEVVNKNQQYPFYTLMRENAFWLLVIVVVLVALYVKCIRW